MPPISLWPPRIDAARLGAGDALELALTPQVGLELGKHVEHVEEHRAGIHRLLRRAQRRAAGLRTEVRAKRGGDLVGPSPTDRAKMDSKYHIAIDGDGTPVACRANVPDTLVFERLFLAAFAVRARIRAACTHKGYDAERHRRLCRACQVKPFIHKRGWPHGSGLD
jgi:hypothetical protein